MRKIVRRVPARTSVVFECGVCKTRHRSKKAAQECEARPTEAQEFKTGDVVRALEKRRCGDFGQEYAVLRAVIVEVLGPAPADYEYEVKWLGGWRATWHTFLYTVEFTCPRCGDRITHQYRTPEIRRVRAKKP